MASVSAGSVTIDQVYFETPVRRSHLNADSSNINGQSASTVPISQAELDRLRSIAGKYENLRRNLLRGGVGEEVVDLLSQDDAAIQGGNTLPATADTQADQEGGARLRSPDPQSSLAREQTHRNGFANANGDGYASFGGHGGGNRNHEHSAWANASPEPDDVSCDGDTPPDGSRVPNFAEQQNKRPYFDRQCTRTIQLVNLADGTTHGDITGAVRGGLLLDIFMRSHERSATVSFLNAADARAFFDHARKHDLYIKNKRVDLRWHDRQFILPGHVAAKIGGGATRNLVIRQIDSRHTEESIRDDLEHIHNLVVVKIDFAAGSCHIKTNSVHNAVFARMCMMSRAKYKNAKIEWDVDECAQPYEKVPQFKPRKEAPPTKKNSTSMANRFHLLDLGDEEEDEISTTFQSKKSVGIAA